MTSPLAARNSVVEPLAETYSSLSYPDWWTLGGILSASAIKLAYRFVSTPGSIWGPGPSSHAECLVNLANPGINNMVQWSVNPATFAALTGLAFSGNEYYTTSFVVSGDGYSCAVRLSDVSTAARIRLSVGCSSGPGKSFVLGTNAATAKMYSNGGPIMPAPVSTNGVWGMAGRDGFFGGLSVGTMANWTGANTASFFVGCAYYTTIPGVAYQYIGKIQAVWVALGNFTANMPAINTMMGQL